MSHKNEWSSDKYYNIDEAENTVISEISQTLKDKYHYDSTYRRCLE